MKEDHRQIVPNRQSLPRERKKGGKAAKQKAIDPLVSQYRGACRRGHLFYDGHLGGGY